MPARKKPATADASRLTILAASGDDRAFAAAALEMLASKQRLQREAALDALVDHPLPAVRDAVRALYFDLDEDGLKRDQGATMRVAIVRILRALHDVRDGDIAARASDTSEIAFGEDISWRLRVHGLAFLAEVAPKLFPYHAVGHLDDVAGIDGEPANSAIQLLAGTGQHVALYQWLISGDRPAELIPPIIELLREAPRPVLHRYIAGAVETAIRRSDEQLATVFAETIVNEEIVDSYPALATLMSAKISDELYNYLAVLLASTNRSPLLAILEEQLHRGRRTKLVADALRLRRTDETMAILRRWEDGDDAESV